MAEARNRGYTLADAGQAPPPPQAARLTTAPIAARTGVNGWFASGGLQLARYLARPAGRHEALPGLILCHGFPIGPLDARQSAITFPELIDRDRQRAVGWAAMTFTFRGCGTSEGDFSLQGWVDDLRAAIDHLIAEANPLGIWIVGTNTGGSIATCVAADDPRVRGAALLSPRADFDDWAAQPRRFLEHAREIGAMRTPGFPRAFDEWARELRRFRPVDAAQRLRAAADAGDARRRRRERAHRPTPAASPTPHGSRRAARHHRRRPPAAPRPASGRGPARLARPAEVVAGLTRECQARRRVRRRTIDPARRRCSFGPQPE